MLGKRANLIRVTVAAAFLGNVLNCRAYIQKRTGVAETRIKRIGSLPVVRGPLPQVEGDENS